MEDARTVDPTGQTPVPSPHAGAVLTALDRIFDCMLEVAPAEAVDWDVPLSLAEVRAFKHIPVTGGISMRNLACSLGLSMPTATHLVDRLVAKGVVERNRGEHDRRVVLVGLTEQSRAHRDQIYAARRRLIERVLEPFAPDAREQAARLFEDIAAAVTVLARPTAACMNAPDKASDVGEPRIE